MYLFKFFHGWDQVCLRHCGAVMHVPLRSTPGVPRRKLSVANLFILKARYYKSSAGLNRLGTEKFGRAYIHRVRGIQSIARNARNELFRATNSMFLQWTFHTFPALLIIHGNNKFLRRLMPALCLIFQRKFMKNDVGSQSFQMELLRTATSNFWSATK